MRQVAEAAPRLDGKALDRAHLAEQAREGIEDFDPETGESELNELLELARR